MLPALNFANVFKNKERLKNKKNVKKRKKRDQNKKKRKKRFFYIYVTIVRYKGVRLKHPNKVFLPLF